MAPLALAWPRGKLVTLSRLRIIHILRRLLETAETPDIFRARVRQSKAAYRNASLRELAAIYRDEMSYTPTDKLRELNSVRPL